MFFLQLEPQENFGWYYQKVSISPSPPTITPMVTGRHTAIAAIFDICTVIVI